MSETFQRVVRLIQRANVRMCECANVRISDHGYDELAVDRIFVRDVLATVEQGTPIEDYPDYAKGPCVLVLQKDRAGESIHAVWGIPKGADSPAVLITAYRPDPLLWEPGFARRRS